MAKNGNNTERKAMRAQRRAEERAEQQARAAQAAKERKQQTIIGTIVIVLVLALLVVAGVAVYQHTRPSATSSQSASNKQAAYEQLQNASPKPKHADELGGILISKDGYNKKVADAPTIGIYMDFMCPGCGNLNRNLEGDLAKMVEAGQINLDLHFMSFMDRFSTDEYSSRAANMALYLSDHTDDPQQLLSVVRALYSKDFQPEEGPGYKSVSNEQLVKQVESAGIDPALAEASVQRNYDSYLSAINTYTPMREELWNVSGSLKGSMTTPTVTINGHFWDMNSATATTPSMVDAFVQAIGLPKDEIGVAGDMPSIGAQGKPVTASSQNSDASPSASESSK
ncbi:DSBA oxidoreductase [Bifidobacterium dolichotidis]|uniref:DSBA oxidoreductase n=1 Tax=Bifidobacterium dolichotidis TaxID=2306976 RepID=A0A430FNW7_9BIFI|nr:thioredoxin domain-containing protein [Bifidobacterium dolichotidis]RSX54518.1 DSBA oxidoreductase [Bifidobacterium dolichotidis]